MYASPISDLALEHILESGLRVLNSDLIDDGRRMSVLHALVQIFTEAGRGSAAVTAQNHMLIALEEPPAFERFALFFRYLNRTFGADLPARLNEASQVFTAIEQDMDIPPAMRNRVAELVEGMLTAIHRESRLVQLAPPKELRLSF